MRYLTLASLAALLCGCTAPIPAPSNSYTLESTRSDGRYLLAVKRPGDDQAQIVMSSPHPIRQPVISSDGQFIIYVLGEKPPTLHVQHVTSGVISRICTLADTKIRTRISPDNRALIVSSKKQDYSMPLTWDGVPHEALPFCVAEARNW